MCKNVFAGLGLFAVLMVLSISAFGQKKPKNFLIGTSPAVTPNYGYTSKGYGNHFLTTYDFNVRYGKTDAVTDGQNAAVKIFEVEDATFSVTKGVPGPLPFRKVAINRNSSDSVKVTALYEVATTPLTTNLSSIYLVPDYVGTMESLINSYVINRGTDNVFINKATTSNNIERVDMLLQNPVQVTSLNRSSSGFLVMERGGNDALKIAAITGATGDVISSVSDVVTISTTHWGSTGRSFNSVVMQQLMGIDAQLKPSQNIPSQNVAGVFVTLEDLKVPVGAMIHGFIAFANDVTVTGNDLLDISKFPKLTEETPGSNGLDFMAGGGFFTRAILIKGNLWRDANSDAVQDASEIAPPIKPWANLVSPSGKVISSVLVDNTGSYTAFIADNNVVVGDYKIILTTNERFEGTTLNAADPLGFGYTFTGVNTGGVPNTTNKTGEINVGPIGTADITGNNFGVMGPLVLPIQLGGLQASWQQNTLRVEWTSLTESNNKEFHIQVSKDGNQFKTIGVVASQALNGNSTEPIQYRFSQQLVENPGMMMVSLFAIGLLLLVFHVKNKWILTLMFMGSVSLLTMPGCVKKDKTIEWEGNTYVRILQIDKDGTTNYSKVIHVVHE